MPVHTFIRIFIVLLLASGLLAECDKSTPGSYVNIPDSAFLSGLIADGVDMNGDGLICNLEAEAIETILLPPSGITDLTGLEAFINLDSLTITLNPLAGIDLSGNRALRYLE